VGNKVIEVRNELDAFIKDLEQSVDLNSLHENTDEGSIMIHNELTPMQTYISNLLSSQNSRPKAEQQSS